MSNCPYVPIDVRWKHPPRRHGHLHGMSPVEFEQKKLVAEKYLRTRGKSAIARIPESVV